MEIGLILALISALSFASGIVIVRKTAAAAGESFSVTAISIFTGVPFFTLAILFSGEWKNLTDISIKAFIMLASAGVIHFIIGRLMAYESFRLIGANRANPFTQTCPIYTIILSWIFLDEKITWFIGIGCVFMLLGAFLITREKRSFDSTEKKKLTVEEVKGVFLSLGAALCWGITPLLIKPAVEEMGSPSAGSLISYTTAAIVMALLMLKNKRWRNLSSLPLKKSLLPMVIAALFTATGQLLYYSSLELSPANVIAPLLGIQTLFIIVFSFVINRKIELFTPKVLIGAASIIAGTVLLFQ